MRGPRGTYWVIYLYEASERVKFMELQNVMVIVRDRRLGEMRSCLLCITFQIYWRIVYMPYCVLPIAGNITLCLSQRVIKIELMNKPLQQVSIVIITNGQKEALRMSSTLTPVMMPMYTCICPNLLNEHLKYIEFFVSMFHLNKHVKYK